MRLSRSIPLLALLSLAPGGCSADDPVQIHTIQVFADALRVRDLRTVCALNVPGKQQRVGCDGVIAPLLHYSPDFPGSKVERRGPTSGWRFSKVVTVPVRYRWPAGEGKLDVTLHKIDGSWRIALLVPVP